jgi:hypothetical protein
MLGHCCVFPSQSGIAQRLAFHKTLVTFKQLPGRETLRGASHAVALFFCSGVFLGPDSPYIKDITPMQL